MIKTGVSYNSYCDAKKIQEQSSKYLETYIKLSSERIIVLSEDITKEVAVQLSALLLHYDNENSNETIYLYIHSDGGDAAALINIYDVIQMINSPIHTICMGKAYSAAAVLLAAGTKGKRFAFKHAKIMLHGIQCLFPIIGQDQINSKAYYDFLKNHNNNIMKILSTHTNQPLEKIQEDCKRDCYLDTRQAIEYGLIDHII